MPDQDVMLSNALAVWTIYERPPAYPNCYVAVRYLVDASGVRETSEHLVGPTLDRLRDVFESWGLAHIARSEHAEPHEVESWL